MKQVDPHIYIQRRHLIENIGKIKDKRYIFIQAKRLGIFKQVCDMIGTPEENGVVEPSGDNINVPMKEYPEQVLKVNSSPCKGCRRHK